VRALVAALALVATTAVHGAEDGDSRRAAPTDGSPAWGFSLTAYPTAVRGGDNYTSAIAIVSRGSLRLEARYNYEAVGARSAFVGWSFAGGEDLTWEVTPLLGGAWGSVEALVPGVELSLGWRRFDLYVEAEYVRDRGERDDSYFYAWSELGFQPVEWLRLGLAGQRTRAYGGERDYQAGPFAQLTFGPLTIGGYWFSPGSSRQVVVGSIGVAF
jgi:hypothetical protein